MNIEGDNGLGIEDASNPEMWPSDQVKAQVRDYEETTSVFVVLKETFFKLVK